MTREQKEYRNFLERAQKIPAVTTVKQAYKRLQSETNEPLFHDMTNAMFDIDFINNEGETDETQFTVSGSQKQMANELDELFREFCRENGFANNQVTSITFVGTDPEV